MKNFKWLVLLVVMIFIGSGCEEESPMQPKNQQPVILSLQVFPEVIGLNDSAIVICQAIDPDGDTLVYDWITDSRLRIQGSTRTWFFHTREHTRVFYPTPVCKFPEDTVWVQCFARDVKGKSANGLLLFIVRQTE